jgi:hypothetical protein
VAGDNQPYISNADEDMDVDGNLEGSLENSLKQNNVTQL